MQAKVDGNPEGTIDADLHFDLKSQVEKLSDDLETAK